MSGWIGVDLDGTLAEYHGWNGGLIGNPVPAMVDRVKKWLAEGKEVRIFTARVGMTGGYSLESGRSDDGQFIAEQEELIKAWCKKHIGVDLRVTATKDWGMIEFWDDRCFRVEMNTGKIIRGEE